MAADSPRFFNVWIVASNMVYRGVPYSVICDWIQEGRLTARDCVRTAEESNWRYIEDHELFKPYLAMPEATPRAEDQADALADIEMDFNVKKDQEGDEDPDMIPLIDISLVLLVFFMMTAQDLMTETPVKAPQSAVAEITDNKTAIMANIMRDPNNPKRIVYFFGNDFKIEYNEETLATRVQDECQAKGNLPQTIIIRAEGALPYDHVANMVSNLQTKVPIGSKIHAQVKERPLGVAPQ
jgi:biopolymer transport protein ExbD